MEKEKSGPTGCFKCGRAGHWSRDCPSSADSGATNPNSSGKNWGEKARKRPKLSAEMLVSEEGLGYVLRHFPRNFKYRGRGHELSDLGNLISMYTEWHSRLLPYYSFDQFVHKVDQVAATKRVKLCLAELRERVARGGDPTKFTHYAQEPISQATPNAQEHMLHDIFETAIQLPTSTDNNNADSAEELPKETQNGSNSESGENDMTDEQKARMEANRLKALEKAAAHDRARSVQVT